MLIQEEPIFRRFNAGAELLKSMFNINFEDGGLIFDISNVFIYTKNSLPSHLEAGYNQQTSLLTIYDDTLLSADIMIRRVYNFDSPRIINAFRLVEFKSKKKPPKIELIITKEEFIQWKRTMQENSKL